MPKIYTSQIGANSGRSNSPLLSSSATPEAFGVGIGRATQALGEDIYQVGQQLDKEVKIHREKNKQEELANKVALFDTTKEQLSIREEVGANGEGYSERVREMYLNRVDEYVADVEDDDTRRALRANLLSRLPSIASQASVYEMGLDDQYRTDQTNQALSALQNRIMADPNNYDQIIADGEGVLTSLTNVPANIRENMKVQWKQNAAKSYFDAKLRNATTKTGVDAVFRELLNADGKGKDWGAEMLPEHYQSAFSAAASQRIKIQNMAESNAKSVLGDFESRLNQDPKLLLDSAELTRGQELIKEIGDSDLRTRMARIMRSQEISRQDRGLPPAELRAKINAFDGNPSSSYPNVPPAVSSAITDASDVFGVSPAYLGATATREYGMFFTNGKMASNYSPKFVGSKTRPTNISIDAYNAASRAGELLETPLRIIDNKTGTGVANGITVSTLGMSEKELSELTKALVNSGFTGFSEKDGALQANLIDTVPANFGQGGNNFGGWTDLSPVVMNTLKDMGLEASKSSRDIKRSSVAPKQNDIDFGMTTQIKDDNGNPTSSAVGVMQFTNQTFLNLIKDKTVAAAIGVNIDNMSDKDILELRKDPRVSVMAGAALAQQNKKLIESTLGRGVNDAELYMAHFLGASRAVALLEARNEDGLQYAADVLPQQVSKANKPVFFNKDGTKKTIDQFYNDVSSAFVTAPNQIAYEDNKVRRKLLEDTEKALKSDPLSHAVSVGTHTLSDLSQEGGFRSRASEAMAVAEYYDIPLSDMKPFTVDEADYLAKKFDDGNAEEKLQILAEIQDMGPKMSGAALSQIGDYDTMFAYAGSLYSEGDRSVATAVVRGKERIKDNPNIYNQINSAPLERQASFVKATGSALSSIPPRYRQAVQDAADAYYVEQMAKTGKFEWKDAEYEKAIQAVLGGSDGNPAIAEVNGGTTILPKGVSAAELESAIVRMLPEDWAAMSLDGAVPAYADGSVINPTDIADEVMLRYIGDNSYNVMLDDGSMLLSSAAFSLGRNELFVFKPDLNKLNKTANRPSVAQTPLEKAISIQGMTSWQ